MVATNESVQFWQDEEKKREIIFDVSGQKKSAMPAVYDLVNEETAKKCEAYAEELKRKFPKMKPARVARKVAERFKLKKQVSPAS